MSIRKIKCHISLYENFVWFIYLFSCFYCNTLYNIWQKVKWWPYGDNGNVGWSTMDFRCFIYRENVEINYKYFHFFICVSLRFWFLIFKYLFFLKVLVDNWKLNRFSTSLWFNTPPFISFVSHSSWIFLFILCRTDNNPMF